MRRYYFILTFLPTLVFAQNIANTIGVVTLGEQYDDSDHKIELLNEDGTVWYTVDCYGPYNRNPDFRILAFKPDYFLFKIKCKGETQTHYEVVVNEGTGLTKNLKKSSKIKFVNWEEYMTDVFSVSFDPAKNKIYDKIEGAPLSDLPTKKSILVPQELKGDWMKVIWTSGDYNYPDSSDIRTGWIRWRMNNRITVTIYHLS